MAAAGINKRDLEGFGLGLGVGLAIGLGICWLIKTVEGLPQPCPAGHHRVDGECVPDNGNGNGDMVRIDVNSEDQLGRPTQGNFIQVYDSGGNPTESGFTPTSFDFLKDEQVFIEAQDCLRSTGCAFDYIFDIWKGFGSQPRRMSVIADVDKTLTAVYNVS